MAKNLADYVAVISGFVDYQPGNDDFKLENLTSYLAYIRSLNDNVFGNKTKLSNIKELRKQQYAEMKDRGDRIKYYVKSKYGAYSHEYLQISSIQL